MAKSPKAPAKSKPTKKPLAAAQRTKKPVAKPAGGAEALRLEGKAAPAFELPDQHGNTVALKDLTARGTVVLYFYPKDMTPGCTIEACSFRDNIGRLRDLGAQVIGISADPSASHQKFIEKQGLNFPLLSDTGNKVTKAFGVYKKKSLYGREFMGIERTTLIIGRDGTIRKVFPKVKVNGHTDEVVAALTELG
jgi:peroxiredoxin Q/BCP